MSPHSSLLYPMAFFIFYVVGFGIYNFICRFKAISGKQVKGRYYKTYSDKSLVNEKLLVLERHFDNQFQVPMVFLITCLTMMFTQSENSFSVSVAWVFVASRIIHAFVHLGSNHILMRAVSYATGAIILLILWVHILFSS